MLKSLLLSDRYKIKAPPEFLEVKNGDDLQRLEDIALLIIKKYLDLFYRKDAKRFETENLSYGKVGEQLSLFGLKQEHSYIVQIDKRKKELIDKIRNLVNNLYSNPQHLQQDDEQTLPRIYFDRHLYLPILLQSKEIDRISPVGLVESEKKFIIGLREYLKQNKDKFSDIELYLLRNYPFSGVGFQLQWSKFYPDFIMWVKKGKRQIIAFIDPKGLEHTKDLNDEKIQFAKEIKQIEQKLNQTNIRLESFILSATPYEKLIKGKTNPPSKNEYMENNVLFLDDDKDWLERLFSLIDYLV